MIRYYKESYVESEIIIDLLGDSKPCDCNGRTDTCDPATGACINCRDNTAGALCDICAAGFYGDPVHGEPCTPCQCPSSDRNFALTCSTAASGAFSCQCQEGYTGPSCDRCEYGYYGNPEKEKDCLQYQIYFKRTVHNI
ncbi:laminin subunit beta-2-like [Eurytemora carolleeae]|uniref:laminin subunit beta-2-like n=1 Tax=Eurytemora carolleeae TaxID=1294199 RepID=UPI000C75C62B|nr:laminin subunit beta-2-like [Eurytemora carolleeae]|eukprot:XP_023333793.1 laminin subunit beta-2-like [Eurytemora affinis]